MNERSSPEPAPRDDVRVAALSRCPFCHADAGVAASRGVCAACLARHHEACWTEAGRCSSCGHTVRLEVPQPPQLSFGSRAHVVIIMLLLLALGALGWTHLQLQEREVTAVRLRKLAEERVELQKATLAAEEARRREELETLVRSAVRAAEAQTKQAEEKVARAQQEAKQLAERHTTLQNQLRAAELRTYDAEARSQTAATRAAAAELRADELARRVTAAERQLRGGNAPTSPEAARDQARLSALTALAHAIARTEDAAEQARIIHARSVIQHQVIGPARSALDRRADLLMFPFADHPEFTRRTTRALEQFAAAKDATSRAYVAHVRLARGDVGGAELEAEAALTLDSACALAWFVRAQVRLALGDLVGAAEDAIVGEALDGGRSCWSLYTRGMIHVAAGEPDLAVSQLELLRGVGLDRGLGLDPALEPVLKEQRDLARGTRPR